VANENKDCLFSDHVFLSSDSCKNTTVLAERNGTDFAQKKAKSDNDDLATGKLRYLMVTPWNPAFAMLSLCVTYALSTLFQSFIHALSFFHALFL